MGRGPQREFDKHFTFDPRPPTKGHTFRKGETRAICDSFHLNNAKELKVLAFASSLDETAALQSASYGAAQVMGFNHVRRSVTRMFRRCTRN